MSQDSGITGQSTISRLVNIKCTYERASILLENPTPIDGAISLVLMDNVMEAIFKLALDQAGEQVRRDPSFPVLLDKVARIRELDELMNYKLSLLRLHRARNGFQHDGVIPDLSTVLGEYKPLAESVLGIVSKGQIGYAWDDISLALLIKSETIRKLYERAERSYAEKDYVTASAHLIYTFEVVKIIAKMLIFGSGLSLRRAQVGEHRKDHLTEYVTILDEEVESFKLGLDYVDIRNYLDAARYVGIDSILYEIPKNTTEETVNDFRQKLMKADISLLKEWYINMRHPVLRFVTRTEAKWRLSLRLLDQLVSNLNRFAEA